jgi:threonine/homoserine/homoserine lactone efflux protein
MENIVALVIATFILVLIPGPNAALTVANTLQYGLRAGIVTVLGTKSGIALQLILVTAGLSALLQAAASALTWIKWLGVIYLIFLAVATWRQPVAGLAAVEPEPKRRIFRRGVMLAVVNPKVLLFNAAFLPQFLTDSVNVTSQLLLVAAVFLATILVGDTLWAVFASSARRALSKYGHLRNRMTAAFLFGASVGLALSKRSS